MAKDTGSSQCFCSNTGSQCKIEDYSPYLYKQDYPFKWRIWGLRESMLEHWLNFFSWLLPTQAGSSCTVVGTLGHIVLEIDLKLMPLQTGGNLGGRSWGTISSISSKTAWIKFGTWPHDLYLHQWMPIFPLGPLHHAQSSRLLQWKFLLLHFSWSS